MTHYCGHARISILPSSSKLVTDYGIEPHLGALEALSSPEQSASIMVVDGWNRTSCPEGRGLQPRGHTS